jgi:nitroreductase
MDLDRALQTTGAVREFSEHPVPDEVIHHILDVARFAPSGGNRQAWRVLLVQDPSLRRRLRELYVQGWYQYLAMGAAGLVPWAPVTDRDLDRYTLVAGASIYPFAWSVLLAAHGAGLGGVLTTMLVPAEDEVRDLLGVPPEWVLAGALALGYPAGAKRPTRLRRTPVEAFATVDRFDGPGLTA